MSAITLQQYKSIIRRQEEVERELKLVKKTLEIETSERYIQPVALRRWNKISRDLDQGKGRAFKSPKSMQKWLTQLARER